MKLARSSFYYKPTTISPDQVKAEADLIDRIEAICLQFPCYGYRRVIKQVQREEWVVNHKKVLRLMRESDLLCRARHRWVKTTDSLHRFPRYPNLIKGVTISRMNEVWLSDITYITFRVGLRSKVFDSRLCRPTKNRHTIYSTCYCSRSNSARHSSPIGRGKTS